MDDIKCARRTPQTQLTNRKTSVFMEISFRVVDSAKNLLGNRRDPIVAWEALEKRFGAGQEGIQSSLIAMLQLVDWDGQRAISTHCDHMVDLLTQLEDTGMTLTDQAFYSYFAESLPESLDLFITLYEDSTYNVDCLCNEFAKYEMRKNVRAPKTAKSRSASDRSVTLFSQQEEKRRETDLSNVPCYGCGKKEHLKRRCPERSEREPQGAKSVQGTPVLAKPTQARARERLRRSHHQGLYTLRWHTLECVQTMNLRLSITSKNFFGPGHHTSEHANSTTTASINLSRYFKLTTNSHPYASFGPNIF